MGERTQRREARHQRMKDQVADALEHPVQSLWARLAVSLIVAALTGGISAYATVQVITNQVRTLTITQANMIITQRQEFQELSDRIDNLMLYQHNDPPPRDPK